jgi:non-ribosomal peptide synthetase component F
MVADGWSLGVMADEIAAGYDALTKGLPDPAGPPQIQYSDYTRWLAEDDDTQAGHLEYWTRHLEGSVPLNLPARQFRPAPQSFAGARCDWRVDGDTTRALKEIGRGTGGTLFMVLLAAYGLVLGRHSYASDVVVGTPVSGRTHLETEGVIGFFVNTLTLRLDLSGDPTFVDLVLRAGEVCRDGLAHQTVRFERLVEALQPTHDLSRTPLVQSALILQNTPQPTLRLTGLEVERLELDTATSKFDISLELQESEGGLVGFFEYSTDLFDSETVARIAADLTRLLRSVATGPGRPISELTAADVPPLTIAPPTVPDTGLQDLIYRQAGATPKAVAVSHGPLTLTYDQLLVRAERLAHELRARGLDEHSRVGLRQGSGADWVVGLLAVITNGATGVLMDPSRPGEWDEFVLGEGRPHLVLDRGNEFATGSPESDAVPWPPDRETVCLCFSDDALTDAHVSAVDLAARVAAIRQDMGITAGDHVVANCPQWKEAAVWECLAALTGGATFVVPAAGDEPATVFERAASAVVLATPEEADALGDAGSDGSRVVRIGESLPVQPVPGTRAVLTSLTAPPSSWEFDAAEHRWYWRPVGAVRAEIRDRFGQPLETGVCGQLHLSGGRSVWMPTGVLARYGANGCVEWLGFVEGPTRDESMNVPAVAPRNPAEEVVAAVWHEVLGCSTYSVHDDFFDLGGHSVAAAQIIGRVHSIFQVKVPIRSFFDDPSIAGFTSALTSLEASPGQTEQIAVIWQQVMETAGDENAVPASGADR